MNVAINPIKPTQAARSAALSRRTSRASFWAISGRLLGKLIDLATFVVLSHYLTPHDLGLVAIAMTAVFVIEAVLDLPIAAALIRVRDPDEALFQTALTLGILRGIAIAVLLAGLSIPIASFYHEPQLVPVILVLSLAPALRGMISPKMIVFARNFDFTKDFTLDICAKSASFLVAFFTAAIYGSYWAIAAATVTAPCVMLIVSYVIAPMRPVLNLSAWPLLANTIGWNSLAQIISALNWQLDRILLPRFISISDFGRFAVATDLAAVPHQTLSQPIVRPLIAAFATVEPGEDMRALFKKASGAYFLLVAPVFLAIALVATPLLRTMLGPQWMDAGWILSWLAINAILALPGNLIYPLAMRLDLTRFIALKMGIEFLVRLPLTGVGIWLFGITGALAAQTITAFLILSVSAWSVHRMIGLTSYGFLSAFARPAIAVAACLLGFYCFRDILVLTDHSLHDNLNYVAATGLGVCFYGATILTVWALAGRPDGAERVLIKMIAKRWA
jgi:O-antigen/teichoic acid export membrane protein